LSGPDVIWRIGAFGPKPEIPSPMITPSPIAYSGVPPGAA
jgi:hypothetical protein